MRFHAERQLTTLEIHCSIRLSYGRKWVVLS